VPAAGAAPESGGVGTPAGGVGVFGEAAGALPAGAPLPCPAPDGAVPAGVAFGGGSQPVVTKAATAINASHAARWRRNSTIMRYFFRKVDGASPSTAAYFAATS
jgi:hypothetical protein